MLRKVLIIGQGSADLGVDSLRMMDVAVTQWNVYVPLVILSALKPIQHQFICFGVPAEPEGKIHRCDGSYLREYQAADLFEIVHRGELGGDMVQGLKFLDLPQILSELLRIVQCDGGLRGESGQEFKVVLGKGATLLLVT